MLAGLDVNDPTSESLIKEDNNITDDNNEQKISKKTKVSFINIPTLTEREARMALEEYVGTKFCYSKKPIHAMSIVGLQIDHAYRYVLQTYTECSTSTYISEAYSDNSMYGLDRCLFGDDSHFVKPRRLFHNEIVQTEVPNTSNILRCDSCSGIGDGVCMSCHGKGKAICYACIGTGRVEEKLINTEENCHTQQSCLYCYGKGYLSCHDCRSTGNIQCFTCKGSGKIKTYQRLTIKFETNQNECLKKPEYLPEQLIRSCHAQLVFSEQGDTVNPITQHPDNDINTASSNLLSYHNKKFIDNRIIAQRHEIYIIPVTHCKCTYNNQIFNFYICGLDQKVYTPDYPKCLNCCLII